MTRSRVAPALGGTLALGAALVLGGCADSGGLGSVWARLFHHAPPPPPPPSVHYVVGTGYQMGGVWYYPFENFGFDQTGIAAVKTGPYGPLTTDGEPDDPTAMVAAMQTLQLPSILRVTNLSNGRQVLVRANDRGPANPGRLIALSPRAATLLGMDADGTARVRVQVESGPSQALTTELHGNALTIAAAPVGAVQSAALAPPPGARGSSGRAGGPVTSAAAADATPHVPLRLPETVQQVGANPGTLWIDAGHFGRADYAQRRAAQLAGTGAQASRVSSGGQTGYAVRIGPLDSVARADAVLAQVMQAGVMDARIEVQE